MELKLTLAALSLSLLSMATANEQAQILIASIIGAGLGGYMGSYYFQGKSVSGQLTFRKRWAANLATGSILGPMATVWLSPRFPDIPPSFLALAAAGILGGCGVLFLTIFIPALFRWIPNRFLPPNPPNPTDPNPPTPPP
jgi:hypothetical protein